jgi:hypothetical protein
VGVAATFLDGLVINP